MKFKTTAKQIKAAYPTISVGYCDVQHLLVDTNADAYTCGVYGWNSDVYLFSGRGYRFAISTGYRPFGSVYTDALRDLVREYEEKARGIQFDWNAPRREERAALLEEFCHRVGEAIAAR